MHQRRVPFEQVERDGLSQIHSEHNSATSTLAAFTKCAVEARVDPRVLRSCHRVLSYAFPSSASVPTLSARKGRPSSSARVSKMAWTIGLRQVLTVQTKRTFFTRSRLRGITSIEAIRTSGVLFSAVYPLTDYTGTFRS
jgi:hypothetical protein